MTASRWVASLIRIFITDEVDRVRQAVRDLVDLQPDMAVVGEAADLAATTRLLPQLQPDVLLMDIRVRGHIYAEAIRVVRGTAPQTPMVVYTANPLPGERQAAVAAGANAFLEKDVLPHDLLCMLRQAAAQARSPEL